jgi:hypothetical protein
VARKIKIMIVECGADNFLLMCHEGLSTEKINKHLQYFCRNDIKRTVEGLNSVEKCTILAL